MWSERWFLSCNAKDIGTCAKWVRVSIRNVRTYTFLDILGRGSPLYLFYSVGISFANNWLILKADAKSQYGEGLPPLNRLVTKIWHGYAKKLETYWPLWVELRFLSRISRNVFINAMVGRSDDHGNQGDEGHSSEESPNRASVQEPKPDKRCLPNHPSPSPKRGNKRRNEDRNDGNREPSDRSASGTI